MRTHAQQTTLSVVFAFLFAFACMTIAERSTPSSAEGLGVEQLTAGAVHNCILVTGGGVKCWGYNGSGRLGNPTIPEQTSLPVSPMYLESDIVSVAAGGGHTCAVTNLGGLKCWGWNRDGQLGTVTTNTCYPGTQCSEWPLDVDVPVPLVAVAAGDAHTCAVTLAGEVMCWGNNKYGQLGVHSTETCSSISIPCTRTPVAVPGLSQVVAVAAGYGHSCALLSSGQLKCWGRNADGELGDGQVCGAQCVMPIDVPNLQSGIRAIAADGFGTCAITVGDALKCWGDNGVGQVGDGTTIDRHTAVDVVGLASGVVSVDVGAAHACAVVAGGGVKCWGSNHAGQLGNATASESSLSTVPVDVQAPGGSLLTAMAAPAAANNYTCALSMIGSIHCWGANFFGQLGNGTTQPSTTAVPVFLASDSDFDGCADGAELSAQPEFGGIRDPKNFWDFFDTPTRSNIRDKQVSGLDFFRAARTLRRERQHEHRSALATARRRPRITPHSTAGHRAGRIRGT